MRNIHFLAITLLLFITACEKETISFSEAKHDPSEDTTAHSVMTQLFVPGEVVIKYDELLSEAQKQIIRDAYGVTNYKNCTCADPTLELWIFELDNNGNLPNGLTIEGVVESSKDDSGVEGAELNPIIKQTGHKLNAPFGPEDMSTALTVMSNNNVGVTIAVLDTGIDYNYFGFNDPFLYNSVLAGDSCSENGMEDRFGWDFVEGDNNPFDEHGHGTQVTSILYEKLNNQNIDFQTLPVKVFDENGSGNYFDILCGFKYASKKNNVNIINMSFGWYNTRYALLERFIDEVEDNVLVITSAGNYRNDNDIIAHYPSSYEMDNILSIASWSAGYSGVELSRFSNFGITSVDLAAPGEDIPFYLTPNEYILLSGTSYSTAFVTAYGGQVYIPGINPLQHISNILSGSIPDDNLNSLKYQSYINY